MLGALKRVNPREYWKHEEQDFTPWLKENIGKLSEEIGIEIEVEDREVGIGSFVSDLIGIDINSRRPVVIENQLFDTDHDHLGKLLTYAAGKTAGFIIWISTKFREEHRQAIDWLNEITDENTHFFGVELELLRIDDSKPAPHFKVVALPNEWQKVAKKPQPPSEKGQRYHIFFSELLDKLKSSYPGITNVRSVGYENWLALATGKSGFVYTFSFSQKGFRVELYIDTGDKDNNKRIFDTLKENKNDIEDAFGQELSWERLDIRRASRIALYRKENISDSPESLNELKSWAVTTIAKFRSVFSRRLANL